MFRTLLCCIACAVTALAGEARLELGANFNEHLTAAEVTALDITGVKWIRGFLPAGEFLDGRRSLATDPGIATFRAAAASGRHIAITLKWDFKRSKWRVPAPDSAGEKQAFAWAVDVAQTLHPDLLLLVNEVFIDTEEADMQPGADGVIPMVRFLQRLAAHVHAAGLTTPAGQPLPVSCGGFTRLDRPEMQERPATRALLAWLAATPDVTHVNFHLHEPDLEHFATAVRFLHAQLPKRPLVVTEFSLVWAYQANLKDRIGATDAGRAFAGKYHRDPAETVADYLSAAARKPVTEDELHAFLGSQPWFDPQSLEKACELMEQNGVVLATYAYRQAGSGLERAGSAVGSGQPPWRLNPVLQERNAYVPDSKRPATNLGFFDTFVGRQAALTKPTVRRDAPENIRGAIYIPAEAYNSPQLWKNFNAEETRRDLGYARSIHLNALRMWASYEYWSTDQARFKAAFDQMLGIADANGIRILISLFENCGVAPTPENMAATDPKTAFDVQSPGREITAPDHQQLWAAPRGFVQWFMTTYGNDPRLLAIEVMNEPRRKLDFDFAKSMFQTAKSLQGTVPLTVGTASIGEAEEFVPLGLDIIEFHDNFPGSAGKLGQAIEEALAFGEKHHLPVWLTEWQRVRTTGPGWDKKHLPKGDLVPDYASLASTVRKFPVGNFFWSLMIKRAYLPSQRGNGTFNGLFWPDGTVWSLRDARAIAADPSLPLAENKTLPAGFP